MNDWVFTKLGEMPLILFPISYMETLCIESQENLENTKEKEAFINSKKMEIFGAWHLSRAVEMRWTQGVSSESSKAL